MQLHSGNGSLVPQRKKKQPKQKDHILCKMPDTACDKFERARMPAVHLPSEMFQSVADVIGWIDMENPAPSYNDIYYEWKEVAEDILGEFIRPTNVEMSVKEEASFKVGKEIAFRALEKFVARAKRVGWSAQSPEVRKVAAEEILERPQIPQRTPAWYAQGKEVLTASEFAKLFGSPRCVSQLVTSKVPTGSPTGTNRLACMTCEMSPFDWGVRFEPVVKHILEKKWGAQIAESGRILHPMDTHVAASPDGIIMEANDPARIGRLLEIKCPITRKISEGIPFEYWCQMQVQMEVTGIGECEYVEVKLDSIQGTATDISGVADGYIWLLQNPTTCEMRYVYTEAEAEAEAMNGWEQTEKIPWRLNDMYTVTVIRDRAWYEGTGELRRQFWENVEHARKGMFQVVEGRSKVIVTKEPACLID